MSIKCLCDEREGVRARERERERERERHATEYSIEQ